MRTPSRTPALSAVNRLAANIPLAAAGCFAALLATATPGRAQQCHDVPDGNTAAGNCIIVPFGDLDPASAFWSMQFYQTLVRASDVAQTGGLVTGLAFAPCGTGVRQFDRLTIRLGHCNLGTLGTTFAGNFTTPGQTVLDVRDFEWPNVAGVWNRIPLQTAFAYSPQLGDLLIEFHCEGVGMPVGTAGVRSGQRDRVSTRNWGTPGVPPVTGTYASSNAIKIQVCLGAASTATFGTGCLGSNQATPQLDYSGSAQFGQTLSIDVTGVAGSLPFMTNFGTSIAPPYPLDLTRAGLTGCRLYTDQLLGVLNVTSATGTGSVPLTIPNDPTLTGVILFNQAAVLDNGANPLGVVTTNGGQFTVGG